MFELVGIVRVLVFMMVLGGGGGRDNDCCCCGVTLGVVVEPCWIGAGAFGTVFIVFVIGLDNSAVVDFAFRFRRDLVDGVGCAGVEDPAEAAEESVNPVIILPPPQMKIESLGVVKSDCDDLRSCCDGGVGIGDEREIIGSDALRNKAGLTEAVLEVVDGFVVEEDNDEVD